MPVSLLIALFLAFGIDVPAGPGPIARPDLIGRLGEALGGLALVGALAFGLGRLVARPGVAAGLRELEAAAALFVGRPRHRSC